MTAADRVTKKAPHSGPVRGDMANHTYLSPADDAKGTPQPPFALDTRALAPALYFIARRARVAPVLELVPDPTVPMEQSGATLENQRLGGVAMVESVASAYYLRCRPWRLGGTQCGPLLVLFHRTGGCRGYNGRQSVCASVGDIVLLDLSRSLDLHLQPSRLLALVVPHELLGHHAAAGELAHGVVSRAGAPAGDLMADLMQNIWQQVKNGERNCGTALQPMLVRSLIAPFAGVSTQSPLPLSAARGQTFEAFQAYIDSHLTDPLDTGHLCRHFSCSQSTLYRLFQPFGGASRYIQRARLNRCLEELAGVRGAPPRIIDLCLRFHFANPSHFSRAFRKAFGATPSQALHFGRAAWPAA